MHCNRVSRRQFLRSTAAWTGGIVLSGLTTSCKTRLAGTPAAHRESRPNILFLAVDDLRTQLNCYGHKETISPAIDQLASEGIVFGRAYCQVPVCGASRASLMTGIRPNYPARFTDAGSRADQDTPKAITLAKHFKNNGYHTISNGKIFHYVADSADSWSEKPLRV
jgi:arylsulfatase A-like enzyme